MTNRQIDEWRDALDHAENVGRSARPIGYCAGLVAATAVCIVAVAWALKRWP